MPDRNAAPDDSGRPAPTTPLVVAIDGPSGSGKSSTARGVAQKLGLAFLDTGAMYRAATWLVLHSDISAADVDAVADLVRAARIDIALDPTAPSIRINGTDVTEAIREPVVSAAVSSVATNLGVRADLVARQQAIIAGSERGIVAEGRDITTVVAPDAPVRVLLVADPAARVARRQAELGHRVSGAEVTDQVIRRDRDDSTVAKFTEAAEGVEVVDSTHKTLSEVIDVIAGLADRVSGPDELVAS
ncbi:MAG TPA: (d)CMP kinase, partial [Microlunatus sp.]|nr:(d)CMP kinase [Microlunatus sp.]